MSELATTQKKRRLTIRVAGLAVSGALLATVLPACAAVTPTQTPALPAVPTTTIIRSVAPAASVQPRQVTQAQPAAQSEPTSSASSSTGSEGSNAATQEEMWLSQQQTPAEISAEPECDDSYNGCLP